MGVCLQKNYNTHKSKRRGFNVFFFVFEIFFMNISNPFRKKKEF